MGTGLGAKHNILIKDATTLEGISRATAIVLDKTGTLTEDKPRLTDVVAAALAENEVLSLAAAAEAGSEHPLAKAIIEGAAGRLLPFQSRIPSTRSRAKEFRLTSRPHRPGWEPAFARRGGHKPRGPRRRSVPAD